MLLLGIDSIEIARIQKSLKNKAFIEKVFGEGERAELGLKHFSAASAAACFAAKEAFGKAVGTGIFKFSLQDVQLLHLENGQPFLNLSGKAKALTAQKKFEFAVSITHTRTVATAVVAGQPKE